MVQILQTSKKQRSNGLAIVIHIWPKIGGNVMGIALEEWPSAQLKKRFSSPTTVTKPGHSALIGFLHDPKEKPTFYNISRLKPLFIDPYGHDHIAPNKM